MVLTTGSLPKLFTFNVSFIPNSPVIYAIVVRAWLYI